LIHLLWCTIRTGNFPNVHKIWIDRTKQKENVKCHVLVSTQNEATFLKQYFDAIKQDNRIEVYQPPYPGVCLPSYKLSSTLEFNSDDIIVFGSDDFTPPQNWDEYLIQKLNGSEGVLMVRDGYQLPDSSNMLHPAVTIPIMTGSSLERMNKVIYHPVYHHMFSDCELYMTAKDLGLLIDDRVSDLTTFEHHHWAAGKRKPDENDQSYHTKWKEDELTWNKRKNMPVEERILVNEEKN
jgi:hypothetical protein